MAITTSTESPREKRKGKPIKPSSAITDLRAPVSCRDAWLL